MEYKLSILIPTLESRWQQCESLLMSLALQCDDSIQVLPYLNKGEKSIGYYRNELLDWASGEYVCFIDDDDRVSSHYIQSILKGLEYKPDCLSLRGVITWKGQNPELFEHSIRYGAYKTTNNWIKYERFPNHLNTIKASIAKQFKFPEKSFGEDTDWATQVNKSGLLKKEIYIEDILYYYNYTK